jgi:hypothetical protein
MDGVCILNKGFAVGVIVLFAIILAGGAYYLSSTKTSSRTSGNTNSTVTKTSTGVSNNTNTAMQVYLNYSQTQVLFGAGGSYSEFHYNNSNPAFGQLLSTNLPLCFSCNDSHNYLYNYTPAGLASNASDLWTVQYTGRNGNSKYIANTQLPFFINETIIKTQNPEMFYSFYSSGDNNMTNLTINGMLYSYSAHSLSYSLVGEKGDYFVWIGDMAQNSINTTNIASTIATDLP